MGASVVKLEQWNISALRTLAIRLGVPAAATYTEREKEFLIAAIRATERENAMQTVAGLRA
jgi:hypothetical protein